MQDTEVPWTVRRSCKGYSSCWTASPLRKHKTGTACKCDTDLTLSRVNVPVRLVVFSDVQYTCIEQIA